MTIAEVDAVAHVDGGLVLTRRTAPLEAALDEMIDHIESLTASRA